MTLEIRKMLVLSTGHLTEATAAWMDTEDATSQFLIGSYCSYGWTVHAYELRGEGMPDDLWDVMVFARSNGCQHILFDADADLLDELPQFDW